MNDPNLPRTSLGPLPSQKHRAIRLKWSARATSFEDVLLPQRVDIKESLFGGIDGSVSCVCTRARMPLSAFVGLPLSVQLVTDTGGLHAINGLIVDAREGECDGSLAIYQFFIRDALSVLERRLNTRTFRQSSVLDVIQTLVGEWRKSSTVLAGAFYLDISNVDRSKFPVREQTVQFDESDADFIRRLCRREGIGWFVRAGKPGTQQTGEASDVSHTLVLYDNAAKLDQSSIRTVAYRPDATIGERDAVTLLCAARQLVPGSIRRFSWDHKPGRVDRIEGSTRVDQGDAGNDLARLLMDSRLDAPHIADSWDDYDRLGAARVKSHWARAAHIEGASGVRNLAIGEWIEVTGYIESEQEPANDRRFTITRLHHRAENNLPKDLNERAQALFTASRWSFDSPPVSVDTPARPSVYGDSTQSRYENTFTGVPRDMPLAPTYDPHVDLPRVHPIIGIVVTPDGEEVFCDKYGRIKVQVQGLDARDHEHADGMGTNGGHNDSAWVRVMTGLAGDEFGENWLPRKGMEVLLDFLAGDPDKMYVAGVFHNGGNLPAAFTHTGSLPGNRYVSGVKTREVKGRRYNQLRLDNTPSEISAQLASEHGTTEVNLGFLTHPRTNGVGEPRGEGAEVRTDETAALRAAKGILLTTYARNKAHGHQLDREEVNQLLAECTELFKSLGDYAGLHGGKAADATPQNQLVAAVKHWDVGSSAPAAGNAVGHVAGCDARAIMALGAAAGSVSLGETAFASLAQPSAVKYTTRGKLNTLINIVKAVTAHPHPSPPLGELRSDNPLHGGRTGRGWSPVQSKRIDSKDGSTRVFAERDNRGKVYLYFCPEDATVAIPNIQGIGTYGVPDTIAERWAAIPRTSSVFSMTVGRNGLEERADKFRAMDELKQYRFYQRLWSKGGGMADGKPPVVGKAPECIERIAQGKLFGKAEDRTINAEAVVPPYLPNLYGDEAVRGTATQAGLDKPDYVSRNTLLGNPNAKVKTVALNDVPRDVQDKGSDAVAAWFNSQSPDPEDHTAWVRPLGNSEATLFLREETPNETRRRLESDSKKWDSNSYHSAILRDDNNMRRVAAMDVAIGQAKSLDDPDMRNLLIAIADWKITYQEMERITANPYYYSHLADSSRALIEACYDYYARGKFPNRIPEEPPPLVDSETVSDRTVRR